MSTLDHRPGLRDQVRARPVLYGSLAVLAITILIVVLVVFQPQRLLYDNIVDEDFPVVEPTTDDAAAMDDDTETETTEAETIEPDATETDATEAEAQPEPTGPVALASGGFTSRSRYTVTGGATVYELEDGSRTLRLEDFESTNGPALFVYLTSADANDSDGAFNADFIDLGELRGNVGNQNYAIPGKVDLGVYDTVVIWCRPFTVAFGAADLR